MRKSLKKVIFLLAYGSSYALSLQARADASCQQLASPEVIPNGANSNQTQMVEARRRITAYDAYLNCDQAEVNGIKDEKEKRSRVIRHNQLVDRLRELAECLNQQIYIFRQTGGSSAGDPISCAAQTDGSAENDAAARSEANKIDAKVPGTVKSLNVSGPRVALVIGNSAYRSGPLKNPANDAEDIGTKLSGIGFDVIRRSNLTTRQIGGTLRDFRSKLVPGSVALVFYAGHGFQIRGENYFPTIDADILTEDDVPTQSLAMQQIFDVLDESKVALSLIFLDACRDNPFARNFRSSSRGLARVDAPSGTLISFATRPGSVAADGNGRNGLYTRYLLVAMDIVDQPIEQVLKRVGRSVKLDSNGKQEPWTEGWIDGDFYFRERIVVGDTSVAPNGNSPYKRPVLVESNSSTVDCIGFQNNRGWAINRDPLKPSQWIETTPQGVRIVHRQADESTDYFFLIRKGVFTDGLGDSVYIRVPKKGGYVAWKRFDRDDYSNIYPVTCST